MAISCYDYKEKLMMNPEESGYEPLGEESLRVRAEAEMAVAVSQALGTNPVTPL